MNYAASRLAEVVSSASAVVSQSARALRAEGHDVIDLGLGEPDFQTPGHIIEAAYVAAKAGQTKYPPTDGTAALKTAIAGKFFRDNELTYAPDEIIVSNGVKQIIFAALMASLEPGQEVLLAAPYFGSYKDIVLIQGGKPAVVPCAAEQGFRLTPKKLDAAITPATRWLFLNMPSNPAGAIYDEDQLRALGDVLTRHPHVLILSDEIYEHILFDERRFTSFAKACPDLKDRILTANGVSKAYAMTGWRIGYGAGPKPLISAMTKVQSQISSGACSIAQAAAAAALTGPQDDVRAFKSAFERRRDLIVDRVRDIPGLSLDPPGGAFYALIGCSDLMGSTAPSGEVIGDDIQLAQYFLANAGVAAVPGSAYGLSPFIRLSTAAADDQLTAAMDRIADVVATLKTQEKSEHAA